MTKNFNPGSFNCEPSALAIEPARYPIVLYPLRYSIIPLATELSHCSTVWSLHIELFRYPIKLSTMSLSYPTIPYSALAIELSHYITELYWGFLLSYSQLGGGSSGDNDRDTRIILLQS